VTDVEQDVDIRRRPERYESDEFRELWRRIRFTSDYEVDIDPDELAASVAVSERLDALVALTSPANLVTEAVLQYDESGHVITGDDETSQMRGEATPRAVSRSTNLVVLVSEALDAGGRETRLTRTTVAKVIEQLPRRWHRVAVHDPVRWSQIVARVIQHELTEHLTSRIRYRARPETEWWDADATFVEVETRPPAPPPDAGPMRGDIEIVPAQPGGPNLYDATYCDSQVEAHFVRALDAASDVRLSIKLPRRLRLPTPVGYYSPDFAIVLDRGEGHGFLVRETKPHLDLNQLDDRERWRILFARAHFDAAPTGDVDFDHTTDDDPEWRSRRRA
jgi:type III restriction enzyme